MATVSKRGNSYRIKVSRGYDAEGKQIICSKTWTPKEGMTEKQIEKELKRVTVLFEEECVNGGLIVSAVKFGEFSEQWLVEYAQPRYKPTTFDKIKTVMKRVNKEIGFMKVNKISTRHIQQLVRNFQNGDPEKGYKALSPKTIKNSVSFISSVLEYAMRLEIIASNPCQKVLLPPLKSKEKVIYTIEEAQIFLDNLLKYASLPYQVFFILAIYGGFRLGEILGLTWKNVDFDNHIIHIRQTSNYISGRGIVITAPKTKKSIRSLKLPDIVFDHLEKLRAYYEEQRELLGTKWADDNDAVIKNGFGKMLNPLTPDKWLRRFCKTHDIKYVSIHGFRHLNASLLINSGVDVRTVSACLGHSSPTTTLQIYAHSFFEAQAKASEAVANNLSFNLAGTN